MRRLMRIIRRIMPWYRPEVVEARKEASDEQLKVALRLDDRAEAAIKSYREAEAAYRR